MAGLGYKTFTAGEVLTAANVQGYLQDQSVMSFANAAARGSAIASPWQGASTFLQDTGVTETYYAAAGTANPGGRSAAGWYQEPIGRVLQVISAASTGVLVTTSSTLASTNLAASITPKYLNSKILVMVTQFISGYNASSLQIQPSVTLERSGTTVYSTVAQAPGIYTVLSSASSYVSTNVFSYYDTPNTTSSITYTVMGGHSGGGTSRFNSNMNYNHVPGQITLMEIAA